MSDDLVKRANYALNDMQGRVEAGKLAMFQECIARVKELEAKLANAEVIIRIIASDKWDERLGEAVDLSCEYLAELKGQTT